MTDDIATFNRRSNEVDWGPPPPEDGNRRLLLIGLGALLLGLVVGLAVFGWWLTPRPSEGASFEELASTYQEAYLLSLAEQYVRDRDAGAVRAALAHWPEAEISICLLADLALDPADFINLTALATALNGEGCAIVAPVARQKGLTDPNTILVVVLLVLLLALLAAILSVWQRLQRQQERERTAADAAWYARGETAPPGNWLARLFRSPFLHFLARRLAAVPLTLLIITLVMYAIVLLAPAEERAALYLPPNLPWIRTAEDIEEMIDRIIEEKGLDDPFPIQYGRWLINMLQGNWGWSPVMGDGVLPSLVRRTPQTLELTFFSALFFLPIGLFSGVRSGWRAGGIRNHGFQVASLAAMSVPPFILALFLMSIFYVGLGWFPPGRTSMIELSLSTSTFKAYTGLLTLDGLLNGRTDITLDALRHLVLPAFVVGLAHWAILARVTRTAMIEVKSQDYITAARSRGLPRRSLVWRHAFRNAMIPGLTSAALSTAALITNVFVIEIIFNLNGLSELIVMGMRGTPDAGLALGFAVYSVLLVLPIMLILDVVKALVDPRFREEGALE